MTKQRLQLGYVELAHPNLSKFILSFRKAASFIESTRLFNGITPEGQGITSFYLKGQVVYLCFLCPSHMSRGMHLLVSTSLVFHKSHGGRGIDGKSCLLVYMSSVIDLRETVW